MPMAEQKNRFGKVDLPSQISQEFTVTKDTSYKKQAKIVEEMMSSVATSASK